VMLPARSHFLDSEIALMLASRRMVEEKAEYKPLLHDLVDAMTLRMEQGAVLSAESYPDECWTFDNAAALDAVRMSDQLDGGDHSDLIRRWVAMAKKKLVDPQSGLLISAYTVSGEATYGPEGSSLWMITHCLRLLDEDFARDQYQRARKALSRGMAGFAWATEWPASWRGMANIDSGPVIPGLEVSAGSSGMAFIGASSFGDDAYLRGLAATLDFSAFPTRKGGRLKYCASNQVGDAALALRRSAGTALDQSGRREIMSTEIKTTLGRDPWSGIFLSARFFLTRAAALLILFCGSAPGGVA